MSLTLYIRLDEQEEQLIRLATTRSPHQWSKMVLLREARSQLAQVPLVQVERALQEAGLGEAERAKILEKLKSCANL